MTLALAVDAAEALRDELEAEVARARDERVVLRSLDGIRIQQRVSERIAFAQRADRQQQKLAHAQRVAALALGLGDSSAESLARVVPTEGRVLLELVGQIRSLAAALSELSAFNQQLAERALRYTRAYVQAMAPRPTYGRYGRAAPVEPVVSAFSRRA